MKVLSPTLDLQSKQIDSVADPTAAQDAATKNYTDLRVPSSFNANTWFGNDTGSLAAAAAQPLAALTEVDDTNVTLTLGGTPATALAKAVSITIGWTGLLAVARGGTGVGTSTGTGSNVLSASPTFTGTAIFATINPTNITGTTTNDDAAAGAIGEIKSVAKTTVAATTAASGATVNVLTLSLPAGDWDVKGSAGFVLAGVPTTANYLGSAFLSTTSLGTADDGYQSYSLFPQISGTAYATCPLPERRFSLAATTTIYLTVNAPTFGSGTCKVYGYIQARRVR